MYEIELRLMPQATCALSLKIMSVLHARAVELRSFSFVRREGHASTASIRVSSSAARLATLVATLDRIVGVVEVTHSAVEVDAELLKPPVRKGRPDTLVGDPGG